MATNDERPTLRTPHFDEAPVTAEKTVTAGSDASSETRAEDQHALSNGEAPNEKGNGADLDRPGTYDKIEIIEEDCYDELGCSFPEWK